MKNKKLQNEIHILFLSNGFMKLYLNDTEKKYEEVESLVIDLGRRSQVFSKKLNSSLALAFEEFDRLQEDEIELLKLPPKNRYVKRLEMNKDGDIDVHGLLFAVALILQHKDFKNKTLHLPYKRAEDIYSEFEGKTGAIYNNARLLADKFVQRITKLN